LPSWPSGRGCQGGLNGPTEGGREEAPKAGVEAPAAARGVAEKAATGQRQQRRPVHCRLAETSRARPTRAGSQLFLGVHVHKAGRVTDTSSPAPRHLECQSERETFLRDEVWRWEGAGFFD
jgi:hypothetical protein